MIKKVKYILIYLCSALLTWVIIDVVFQQSKIISGLHAKVDDNGTSFRANFHLFSFNEGVGIQYTDSNGIMIHNSKEGNRVWNMYGDSFIEALQVFQRHHFANELAEQKNVTIRNFGQSSMNFESMYARYFLVKEAYPANKHIFFISSDDFDTDDIGDFLALPEFDEKDSLMSNNSFDYKETLQRKIEHYLNNSSTLMLAKSDLRQIKNGQTPAILLDKFYTESKENPEYPDLVRPKRVIQLLLSLKNESNIVWIYRGKEPMSEQYETFFKTAGIPIINLQKAIETNGTSDYYYHKVTKSSGHWNREGHKFIAEFLKHEL